MSGISRLMLFFSLLVFQLSYGQEKTNFTTYQTIYVSTEVDSMPQFKGGEDDFFRRVEESFRVNDQIIKASGKRTCILIADFVVSEQGEVSDIRFGGSGIIPVEEEMKRVLSLLQNWKPAVCQGQNCACRIYIPFRYVIDGQQFALVNAGNELLVGHKKGNAVLKWVIVLGCLTGFYFLWMK